MKSSNAVFAGVMTLVVLMLAGCGTGVSSGNGKKIGQIVKIGEHGMMCRTYEAEMIRGGFNGGSGVNGTPLDFTILDKKLYEQLVKVMEDQQEIELTYQRANFSGPCTSETGIFATGFTVLSPTPRPTDEKEQKRQELLRQLKALE